jgi:adenylate kinase
VRLVLIGPPGAGKGTHCKTLSDKYGLKHLSSGDIFRSNIAAGTEIGQTVQKYLNEGNLVPDEIVIEMMTDAVRQNPDCVLDGFPRTINQAASLDASLEKDGCSLNAVIELEVSDELVVSRLANRRVCPECGAVYHLVNIKPKVDNICDVCGSKLVQRDDDNADVISSRLVTYHNQTEPILDYYKNSGKKMVTVDAGGKIDEITKELISAIDNI